MINRIAEIAARCEAFTQSEAVVRECEFCTASALCDDDIPFLLSQLAERDREIRSVEQMYARVCECKCEVYAEVKRLSSNSSTEGFARMEQEVQEIDDRLAKLKEKGVSQNV